MIASTLLMLLILMVLYFALRVNHIEGRMNQLEKNFNRHLKEGNMEFSNTERVGRPFEDKGTIRENFQGLSRDFKEWRKGK